mgnify:CR=1 FL=1
MNTKEFETMVKKVMKMAPVWLKQDLNEMVKKRRKC